MIVAAEKGERGAAKGVLLADSMGMGKTVQVIAAFETHRTDRTNLFVLPISLFDNWQEELTKFLKPCPKILLYGGTQFLEDFDSYDIVFVSYSRLRKEYITIERYWKDMNWVKFNGYPMPAYRTVGKKNPKKRPIDFTIPRFPLLRYKWGRIIFEEAQQLRNYKTATLRACATLKGLFRILLTETPLSNEYGDIHSILRVLRVAPFDDLEWFKSHFLRKRSKKSNQMAYGQRVRENEIPPLDVTRNAFLFLALQTESIRRTRDGYFNGIPLSQGLPKLREFDVTLDLDDGKRYGQIFQYAMQDIPRGCNLDQSQMYFRVDQFFAFVYDPHQPLALDGSAFMRHPDNFHPRTERETQLITKKQWSNKLRDAIKNDLEAGYITEDDIRTAEPDHDQLLANISMGRLAGAHWAVPGAKYGMKVPIVIQGRDIEIGTLDELDGIPERRFEEARTVFKRWLRAAYGDRWRSTKMDWIVKKVRAELNANGYNRFVITCDSVAVLDVVEAALEFHGIEVLCFDGTMKPQERTTAQLKFQARVSGTPRVLLLTSASGGADLNLTAANRMIIVIPEWSKAAEDLIKSRLWREGQEREVEIYHLLCSYSMDLRVMEKQIAKQTKGFGLLDLYTLDPNTLSAGDRQLVERTREKMKEMMTWTKNEFKKEVSSFLFQTFPGNCE